MGGRYAGKRSEAADGTLGFGAGAGQADSVGAGMENDCRPDCPLHAGSGLRAPPEAGQNPPGEAGDTEGQGTFRGSSDLFRPSAALGPKGREMEGKSLTSKSAI
ncbi:hypothetical protein GPL15_22440 [Clostridium sp. MCC353]|uniref:hypothetical protein n=1 Tax=Clostridium sp. MCC353 TaxID=2592646 RepID=UPI001C021903|nr:hypothetical protein [Clostridium sp. MCC353]MBT9779241.1 hypothetical protein [Clostridium sp. MCC353]